MRFLVALCGMLILAGCSGEEKIDMSTMKSPDAGVLVPNQHISQKPTTSPYKIQKISDGLTDQTKK